jgi:hypothetical protein
MRNKPISIMEEDTGYEGIRASSGITPRLKRLDPAYHPFMSPADVFMNGGNAWFLEQMKIAERLVEEE